LIPIRNNALETALACSMYSCVDVFIQTPPCFVFKASGIEVYLVDNKEIKESGYLSHCTVVEFRRK
jgi:hypothetical protein